MVDETSAKDVRESGQVRLFVGGEQGFATHVLPRVGKVRLGSAPESEVRVQHPSVLHTHAVMALDSLSVTALDPKGSVRVGTVELAAGETRGVSAGDVIYLGEVVVMVEGRLPDASAVRRIPTHGYFEIRLEEECARGARYNATFAILTVICREGPTPVVEDILAKAVRRFEPLAIYAPGEYEVLLSAGATRAHAERVAQRFADQFGERKISVQVGIACYPEDGQDPHELIERARKRASGEIFETILTPVPEQQHSKPLALVYEMAMRVAASDISVMLLGETGVGKELLAQTIQQLSVRHDKPYMCINCATLSDQLFESELFGHERGAFTGAVTAKAGLLEVAHGGTVFLDEIGDMPLSTQGKLLRVIEERAIRRVGGVKSIPIDVRFISATHRNLERDVAAGHFRADLYYRLNGIALVLPPLRERVIEIPRLAQIFANEAAQRLGSKGLPAITEESLALLCAYHWPGNLRELRNVMDRAVLLCGEQPIEPAHLPTEKLKSHFAELPRVVGTPEANAAPMPPPVDAAPPSGPGLSVVAPSWPSPPKAPEMTAASLPPPPAATPTQLRSDLANYERERIISALAQCAGNQSKAATMLGMPRRTLVKRLEEYQIPRPRKGREPAPPAK